MNVSLDFRLLVARPIESRDLLDLVSTINNLNIIGNICEKNDGLGTSGSSANVFVLKSAAQFVSRG